jgi:hypothetical protein
MTIRSAVRGWKRWVVVGAVGIPAALVVGPFVFIHFVEGKVPAPLALAPSNGQGHIGRR